MYKLDERAAEAVLCLVDAQEGRLNHGLAVMSKKADEWKCRVFRLQTSSAWLKVLVLLNVVHCLAGLAVQPGRGLGALSWLCATAYAADVGMKVYYEGLEDFWSKQWQRGYASVCLLVLVGELVPPLGFLSRLLRPLVSSLRVRVLRRFFGSLLDTVPGSLRILLPMLVLVLLSTMVVYSIVGDELQHHPTAFRKFRSPLSVAATLWGLMLSLDSYTELVNMQDPVVIFVAFVFFFIVVGHVFLLSLLVGVTYDVFVENTKAQLESDRQKELQGITKAFAVLDPEGEGRLSLTQWHRFTHKLCSSRCTKMQSFVYYQLLAHEPDNLDILDFLHIFEVFNYDVSLKDAFAQRLSDSFFLSRHGGNAWLSGFTTVLDCLLWFLYHEAGPSAFHPGVWRVSTDVRRLASILGTALLAGWVVELFGLRRQRFQAMAASQVAWTLGVAGAAALMVAAAAQGSSTTIMEVYQSSHSLSSASPLEVLSFVSLLLRCVRVFDISDILMDHLHGFMLLAPALYYSAFSSTVVIYVFSQACQCVLGRLAPERFGSPPAAMLTGAQIFFGADVESVLEEATGSLYATVANSTRDSLARHGIASEGDAFAMLATVLVQLFIRAYHTFGTLIMLNLVTAVVMNFYTGTMSELSETSRREQLQKEEQMCQRLVNSLTTENVLKLWKRALDEGSADKTGPACPPGDVDFTNINIRLRTKPFFGVTDRAMRAKLTGFSNIKSDITDAQLQRCNKYAPPGLDLVEVARSRTRRWSALAT